MLIQMTLIRNTGMGLSWSHVHEYNLKLNEVLQRLLEPVMERYASIHIYLKVSWSNELPIYIKLFILCRCRIIIISIMFRDQLNYKQCALQSNVLIPV